MYRYLIIPIAALLLLSACAPAAQPHISWDNFYPAGSVLDGSI